MSDPNPFSFPAEAAEISPEIFAEALDLASDAAAGNLDINPQDFQAEFTDEDGKPFTVQLDDSAFSRIMLAFKDRYQAGGLFESIAWRFSALTKLVREGTLDAWVKPAEHPGYTFTHPAVIAAAATQPLSGRQGFDEASFLARVKELAG